MTKVPFAESHRVFDCHEVTVGHQEKEEEEVEQEVESDGEEHSRNAAHGHGWDDYERKVRAA